MASSNIARLGVILALDTALFTAAVQEAINTSTKLKSSIARESKAAEKEIQALKYAIEDYGKEVSKVTLLERELENGRFKSIKGTQLAADLLAQAKAYDQIATSQKKAATGLTDQQRLALTYQTTDLITQLASGQNAMIALLQQGGQLKDQMGGFAKMFEVIGMALTPVRIAIGATAAVVGTLAFAFYKGSEEAAKFRDDLILTNNYAKVTTDSFQRMAGTISKDLNVSIGNTKDVLSALVSSGQFTNQSIDSVAKAILNVSKLTGESAKDTAQKLIPAFDGTAASAKRLNDQYHFLSLAQYKQIELLEKQGKLQESAKLAADAFNISVQGQTRELGILEKSWNLLKGTASSAWDAMLGIGRESTIEDKLREAQAQVEKYQKVKGSSSANPEYVDKNIKEAQAKVDSLSEQIRLRNRALQRKDDTEQINDYVKNQEKRNDLALQLEKDLIKNRFTLLANAANDETKMGYEAVEQMLIKVKETEAKNKKEGFVFAKENQKILEQEILAIENDLEEKLKQLRKKKYADEMNERTKAAEEIEQQTAEEIKRRSDIYNSMVAASILQKENLEFETKKLQLQESLINKSEQETKLAYIRLNYEKERKAIVENQELTDARKMILIDQLDIQRKLQEGNVALEMSVKRMSEMYDSVWNNLSNALDNFVRTGKLSFRDLTKSIIQDLLLIQMKAQAMAIFKFIGNFLFGPSSTIGERTLTGYADGGSPPVGRASLVGERGPELFIPRTAGTIVPNSQLASLGGTTNVTNNYINAIDTKSFEDRILGSSSAIWAANAYAQKSLAVGRGRA